MFGRHGSIQTAFFHIEITRQSNSRQFNIPFMPCQIYFCMMQRRPDNFDLHAEHADVVLRRRHMYPPLWLVSELSRIFTGTVSHKLTLEFEMNLAQNNSKKNYCLM